MHGAEGFPNQVGRDLDLLVDSREHHSQALQIAKKLDSEGWRTTIIKRPWGVTQIIASRLLESGITIAFETDLVARQVWCGIPLAVGPPQASELLEIEQGMQIALWGGFVKALLIQCLAGNWSKMRARRQEWALDSVQESIVRPRLSRLAGPNAANTFLAALKSADESKLATATRALKRQLLLRHFVRPLSLVVNGSRWLCHRWRQRTAATPRSPLLILSNHNGDTHASIADGLARELNDRLVFPGIRIEPIPRNNDPRAIKRIRHLSAMGVLVVHITAETVLAYDVAKWFPSAGIVIADWSAECAANLSTSLMERFHALHRESTAD